jgi:hypothetical protein
VPELWDINDVNFGHNNSTRKELTISIIDRAAGFKLYVVMEEANCCLLLYKRLIEIRKICKLRKIRSRRSVLAVGMSIEFSILPA